MSVLQNHPRYQVDRTLGHGGFATVYLAWDRFDSRWVAVKIFLKQDQEGVELCRKEYVRTRSFSHPRIIQLLDFGDDQGHPFIVMPFYNEGTMQDRVGNVTEEELWRLIYQVGDALQYLHSRIPPVLHNDLKPDNFLVTDDQDFVLTDFGISMDLNEKLLRSRDINDEEDYETKGRGPMAYLAPETFQYRDQRKQPPTMASEIWSFGVSLYELATGEVPFGDQGGMYQVMQTKDFGKQLNDLVEQLPPRFSGALSSLIMNCLSVHPWERPRAKVLVEDAEVHLGIAQQPMLNPHAWQAPPSPPPNTPPQMPAPTVGPRIYKSVSNPPRPPQYPYPPEPKTPLIPRWLLWILLVILALVIGGLVGKYLTDDKGNVHIEDKTGTQLTDTQPNNTQTDHHPPTDGQKKKSDDQSAHPDERVTDAEQERAKEEEERNRRAQEKKAADEQRKKKEEIVGPPNNRPPYKHARHPYFHYVFDGFRSEAAAKQKKQELENTYSSYPTDIVKVSVVDDYEVYFGNFRSKEDMEAFKRANNLRYVSMYRHGDQEH